MADHEKQLEFIPKVYERSKANVVLDKTFKEFGQTTVESKKTVSQFFQDYEDLFYQIPVTGSLSHQYLVEKSSELYKLGEDETLSTIQPLIDEITLLRSQSVADQQTILDLQIQISNLSGSAAN